MSRVKDPELGWTSLDYPLAWIILVGPIHSHSLKAEETEGGSER